MDIPYCRPAGSLKTGAHGLIQLVLHFTTMYSCINYYNGFLVTVVYLEFECNVRSSPSVMVVYNLVDSHRCNQ